MTRTLSADDTRAFLNNIRWFAGTGRVKWRRLSGERYAVTASKSAWSNFILQFPQ